MTEKYRIIPCRPDPDRKCEIGSAWILAALQGFCPIACQCRMLSSAARHGPPSSKILPLMRVAPRGFGRNTFTNPLKAHPSLGQYRPALTQGPPSTPAVLIRRAPFAQLPGRSGVSPLEHPGTILQVHAARSPCSPYSWSCWACRTLGLRPLRWLGTLRHEGLQWRDGKGPQTPGPAERQSTAQKFWNSSARQVNDSLAAIVANVVDCCLLGLVRTLLSLGPWTKCSMMSVENISCKNKSAKWCTQQKDRNK